MQPRKQYSKKNTYTKSMRTYTSQKLKKEANGNN